jgi:hypothetical protein
MKEDTACIEETSPEASLTVEETPKRRQGAETFGVTCPSCGGSLRVREGQRSIRCEYCAIALYITRPRGVRSFMMNPRITSGKAKLSALKYLSSKTDGRIKARHASIIDIQLVHVPFWRMHGRLMGWLSGDKTESREVEIVRQGPDGPTVQTTMQNEQVPFTKLVFKRVDWSTPACALRSLGLQGISLRTNFLDWDVFDHEMKSKYNFALPMESLGQARKDAYTYVTRVTKPTGARISASRFHLFDSSFTLYYYPVYFIRFRHRERIYTITIDGNSGGIIRGELPARERTNYRSMFFVPAALAFLAGTYFPLALIAAGAVYVFDLIQTEGFLPPYRWLVHRLNRWFGGETSDD